MKFGRVCCECELNEKLNRYCVSPLFVTATISTNLEAKGSYRLRSGQLRGGLVLLFVVLASTQRTAFIRRNGIF